MGKALDSLRIFLFAALLGIGVGWTMPMALHAWEPGECEENKRCDSGGDSCRTAYFKGCHWNLVGICHTEAQGCEDY